MYLSHEQATSCFLASVFFFGSEIKRMQLLHQHENTAELEGLCHLLQVTSHPVSSLYGYPDN